MKLFVSHDNSPQSQRILAILQALSHQVSPHSDDIAACEAFIVLLSPAMLSHATTFAQLAEAEKYRKPILLMLLTGVAAQDLPPALANYQRLHYTDHAHEMQREFESYFAILTRIPSPPPQVPDRSSTGTIVPPPPPPKPSVLEQVYPLYRDEDKIAALDDAAEEASETVPEPSPEKAAPEKVEFSVFHPQEASAETWYTLLAYVHVAGALDKVQEDAAKFMDEMGGSQQHRHHRKATQLQRGTELTFIPRADEVEFKPTAITLRWDEDIERAQFRCKAKSSLLGEAASGEMLVCIGPIEVACVRFAFSVIAADDDTMTERIPPHQPKTPQNPLALARLRRQNGQLYQKIFISYSRKDAAIAKAYRLAQIAAGHEVFLDTESIRAGEDWQAALADAIDKADIFQLFWSSSSAASQNVRDEWDYCLHYKCAENECRGFIRPVYWQMPMPPPPPELGHLNFRYVPLNEKDI